MEQRKLKTSLARGAAAQILWSQVSGSHISTDKPSTLGKVVVAIARFVCVTATSLELVRRVVLKPELGQASKIRHRSQNTNKIREHLRRVDDHDLRRRIPERGTGGVGIGLGSVGFPGRECSFLGKMKKKTAQNVLRVFKPLNRTWGSQSSSLQSSHSKPKGGMHRVMRKAAVASSERVYFCSVSIMCISLFMSSERGAP